MTRKHENRPALQAPGYRSEAPSRALAVRRYLRLIGIIGVSVLVLARFIGLPVHSPLLAAPVLGAPGDLLNGPTRAAAQGPDTGPYTLQQTLGRGMIRSAAWSPDSSLLAVGGALGIWLYTPDLADVGLLKGHTKAVYGLAFSPDGKRLASASHDLTVRIWDVEAQTELHTMEGHTGLTVAVAWSPDGSTVASGAYDHTVRLWDAETGEAIRVLEGHTGWVNQVAFSTDGSQVISSGFDGTIHVWNAITGDLLDTLPGTAAQWAESTGQPEETFLGAKTYDRAWSLSPDGHERVVADWDGWVSVVDVATGDVIAAQPEHADWLVAVGWDNMAVLGLTGESSLLIWDTTTGALDRVVPAATATLLGSDTSANGARRFVVYNGVVRILDVPTNGMVADLSDRANAAAWSPDGTQIAVALRNGTVQIWGEE